MIFGKEEPGLISQKIINGRIKFNDYLGPTEFEKYGSNVVIVRLTS